LGILIFLKGRRPGPPVQRTSGSERRAGPEGGEKYA